MIFFCYVHFLANCAYALPNLQKQKQHSITVSVLANANIQREDGPDDFIWEDLEGHKTNSKGKSKASLPAQSRTSNSKTSVPKFGTSLQQSDAQNKQPHDIDVAPKLHDPESNLQGIADTAKGMFGKAKGGLSDAMRGGVADKLNAVNKMFVRLRFGIMPVTERDYPFQCLCNKDGMCVSNLSGTKGSQDETCFDNANSLPDLGGKNEGHEMMALMFTIDCAIIGILLGCCCKAGAGGRPDLLPKPGSSSADDD